MNYQIPFNKPHFAGNEQQYMAQAMEFGHVSGDGRFTKDCHEYLQTSMGAQKALLTTSCTHALEMCALLLNIRPGDEVILPSFTFVSTVNAFVLSGAIPVFADIDPDTLNISPEHVKRLISKSTKAIIPVHYAGVGCEMDELSSLADAHGIAVVEDNAHGLFGRFKGKTLGTFGRLATQSFHETKNFQCGEGGALIINDPLLIERAEIIREKGTNRSRFFRGQVDKYTWVDVGSSYLPSDLLAAFLLAQLEKRDEIQSRRQKIWDLYFRGLQDWASQNQVRLPIVPGYCEQTYHMFYMLMPSLEDRTALISHLKEREILAVYHYLPLHLSSMGQSFGGKLGDCPVTEVVADTLVRLPFFFSMTDNEVDTVITAVRAFRTTKS